MATFHFLWLASPHKQKLEGAAVLTAVLFVSEMGILEMSTLTEISQIQNKWKEIGDLQWLCHHWSYFKLWPFLAIWLLYNHLREK